MIKLLALMVLIRSLDAARILAVFPTPSISHQVPFRPLTQELAKRGHEVVVITPDPTFAKLANFTEIDVHDISYKTWKENFFKLDISGENYLNHITEVFRLFYVAFEAQMKVQEVQDVIGSGNHYDLLLLEACVRPALVFSHLFKSPVIHVSSFGAMIGTYEYAGAPTHPLLYPSVLNQRLNNLTMWEKMKEFYNNRYIDTVYRALEDEENVMIKNIFGPGVPPLNQLYDNVDLSLLNVDPVWDNNQPIPPNVVYMGGIHRKPKEGLSKELQSFLDRSKNGVIYVSFGTNVDSSQVPSATVQAMISVYSQLKYNVLWKWDDDKVKIPTNVKIMKWLPQMDVLLHPNVKLFVTQAGLQSTQEAINAGVPLVAIPVIADQWYNAEKYVYHKIGMKLDISTLTVETFKAAILTVIEVESYTRNIIKLRDVMYDQPQTPLERAIWWTEYVLRHGGARHLRSPAANMTWVEYYELKLIGLLLAGLLTSVLILGSIVKHIWILIWNNYVLKVKIKSS